MSFSVAVVIIIIGSRIKIEGSVVVITGLCDSALETLMGTFGGKPHWAKRFLASSKDFEQVWCLA